MEQTENLGLYLWDGDDTVNVEQINTNFEKLDGARSVHLKTHTISTTTTTVDLDVSDIDWSKYRQVVVRCYMNGSGTLEVKSNGYSSYDRALRINAGTTDSYMLGYIYQSTTENDCQAWLILKCAYNANRCLVQECESMYWNWGYNTRLTFAELNTLRLYNSDATVNAGSYLEVWGDL